MSNQFVIVTIFIFILCIFQLIFLGFVSYPGVYAFFLRILLGMSTLLYYYLEKLDFIKIYIKIITFLAIFSLPFYLLDIFGCFGFDIGIGQARSLVLYTVFRPSFYEPIPRNSGMFWEPGAFAGYLIVGLLFIAFQNGTFSVGKYKRETYFIVAALLTTLSTTGYICLASMAMLYLFANFTVVIKYILITGLLIFGFALNESIPFLREKLEWQYKQTLSMTDRDVSNTRFGAFRMDIQYIKASPFIGNGIHIKTRYRFHPSVEGDIGHGNGMSNFIACWGIPLFIFWMFQFYRFARSKLNSRSYTLMSVLIILLTLQGEQFLNFPLYILFFIAPGYTSQSIEPAI